MKTPSGEPLEPVFDWYQFSTHIPIRDVLGVLEPLGQDEPFRDESPKLKGYAWAKKVGGRGGSVLIHYGGKNGDEHGPNVAGTGPLAPSVADLVRTARLPHGVGRTDVRLDFLGDFDECRLKFIERCDRAGMAPYDNGSCPESAKQLGRTVYGGSKSSFYQATLYQKGLQLGDGYPTNYLRLEHRFAPTKATDKRQLAQLTPTQITGLRPVSRDLSESIAQLAVEPYKLTKYPKERTPYHWMLSQYRSVFDELLQDHGSPSAVGQQLYLDLEQMHAAESH
ncbi:MAG TPA: hypothetical protein VNT52_18445 [Acidimicrobiales bacterium]|nr:hypothetical protein [Acidimicrobiales bacterium]